MIEVVRIDHGGPSSPLGFERGPVAASREGLATTGATFLAECATLDPTRVEVLATSLPAAERQVAAEFAAPARRTGFLAGRLALHAALAEAGIAGHERPILRDARGRPEASFAGAPPFSIAHSKRRAVAIVAPRGSCDAVGIDVEEIEAHRAEALRRMALSAAELERLGAVDPTLVEAPLCAWCAREASVKAHALEIGWFGTALVIESIARLDRDDAPVAGALAAWRIDLRLAVENDADRGRGRAAHGFTSGSAIAWRSGDAILAVAVRHRAPLAS